MKDEFLRIRKHLDRMEQEAVGAVARKEYRDREVAKVLRAREDTIATSVKNLTQARQDLIDGATYKPKDDTEALARRLRIESEFAAMNRGALLKYQTEDPEILSMQAATLRKRGMHDEADEVFQKIEQAKMAPYHHPLVKSFEQEIARFGMLAPSADPDQLWIGTDAKAVQPGDFASVIDGKIIFKDNDGKEVVI